MATQGPSKNKLAFFSTAIVAAVLMFVLSTNLLATFLALLAGFVSAWLAGQLTKGICG